MRQRSVLALAGLAAFLSGCTTGTLSVDPATIRGHQAFLASEALRGRGSASQDEAVAAAYVASRFEQYGLTPAPGYSSYLQTLTVPPSPGARQQGIPDNAETRNVIGFLRGTDPKAGYLLISAHLDHLGVIDGKVHLGANDDASGTTAVLELARLLAKAGPHRRGILFVAYGAEEPGAIGSRYFAAHPPVPVGEIVANIEFEMIGAADPKLPSGLMMTGFERSDLGALLRSKGALLFPDPYPEQRFFERSDNYELALAGVVAHTVSGWPTTPVYHQVTDTNANIDFAFMARAIQSLVEPIHWLANSDARPKWKPGGQPQR
ncbi:MAG: M28 family peptidase [Sphingomicrobium sp.]